MMKVSLTCAHTIQSTVAHNHIFQGYFANVTKQREIYKFPTEADLKGAAAALVRLQDTYKLETSSLARGELNKVKYR